MKLFIFSLHRRYRTFIFSVHTFILTLITTAGMFFSACKKSDSIPPPTIPIISTMPITNITSSSATVGGIIVSDGNAAITQSGFVWSKTNAIPTLSDSVISGTKASGSFTTNLTGLDFNTNYYIRAYATNSVGTGYGNVVTLNTTNDTTKVRFIYNGQEVVYGIIISPATGKKWLDRNLGAKRVATSYDDYQAYGDFFQWGRPADGHQLINWTSSIAGTAVNGTASTLSYSDIPGHSNFIIPPDNAYSLYDWRSDNNRNRWATSPQGPCPAGWHVPIINEWSAEMSKTQSGGTAVLGGMTGVSNAYSQLKLTIAGYRKGSEDGEGGKILRAGTYGHFWSSSDVINPGSLYSEGSEVDIEINGIYLSSATKAWGFNVRCIMN